MRCLLRRKACGVNPSGMSEARKQTEKVRREQRLQAALRENLKRRKAQARARSEKHGGEGEPHDSAGIVIEKK